MDNCSWPAKWTTAAAQPNGQLQLPSQMDNCSCPAKWTTSVVQPNGQLQLPSQMIRVRVRLAFRLRPVSLRKHMSVR